MHLKHILPFIALSAAFLASSCTKDMSMKMNDPHNIKGVISYRRAFPDQNDVHLAVAQAIGVAPMADLKDVKAKGKKLRLIESCNDYTVDSLTHSHPYLIPGAAKLLSDIGTSFLDSLENKGLNPYQVVVTSVTRTTANVQKLRKRNINAVEKSAHSYGTTFDISWKRFKQVADPSGRPMQEVGSDTLKMVLSEVLNDIRKAKRCYIKYELKQGCFHITSREK